MLIGLIFFYGWPEYSRGKLINKLKTETAEFDEELSDESHQNFSRLINKASEYMESMKKLLSTTGFMFGDYLKSEDKKIIINSSFERITRLKEIVYNNPNFYYLGDDAGVSYRKAVNKFLDDLRQAHALIHIVDSSGSTDAEGNPCTPGSYDPMNDISFLEKEITYWMQGIIKKGLENITRKCELEGKKIERLLAEQLTGLGIREEHITDALRKVGLNTNKPSQWTDEEVLKLSDHIRHTSKPMLIAYNKIDISPEELVKKQKDISDLGYRVIPTSAEAELALTHASDHGFINYIRGGNSFTISPDKGLSDKQKQGLHYIQSQVLDRFGSTGIQRCIEESVKMLDLIVVYPVEDDHHLTDKEGRILPDAFLLPRGSTAKDLAYKVHTDIGDHFIRAINARTKRVVGADYELQDGDVLSIVSSA